MPVAKMTNTGLNGETEDLNSMFMRNTIKQSLLRATKRIICILLIFLMGFFAFLYHINYQLKKTDQCHPKQAIIVLTGGVARIDNGLNLLKKNCGRVLLISGVHDKFARQALNSNLMLDDLYSDKIFLGYIAHDTLTNALESAIFLKIHKMDTILLVTSDYHVPRASFLFKNAFPNKIINIYPVHSEKNIVNLFIEYSKYVVTFFMHQINRFIDFAQNPIRKSDQDD